MKDFFTHVNEHRKSPEVFLGGTTNSSDWREKLIPLLKITSTPNYSNLKKQHNGK